MKKTAYIGIGSNLGDKLKNCREGIDRLAGFSDCIIKGKSSFYRTEPVGIEDQPWYVNGVISISTSLSAMDLLQRLLSIEKVMGRERKKRWDSRIIDLDLLIFGQENITDRELKVPHPRMHKRKFVLAPIVQLAPDLIHPVLDKSMSELLDNFSEEGQTLILLGEE